MTRQRILLSCAALLLATATAASADMGTPLMWAGFLHLLVGNLLIGTLEGLVVSRLFGAPRKKSVIVMIMANYFSMVAGMLALSLSSQWTGWHRVTIHNARSFFLGAVLASLVVSAMLEFPFCLHLMKRTHGWIRATIATVVAQVSSYSLLVLFYIMASQWSLLRLAVEAPASLARSRNVWVYFIDDKGGDVCRVRLDGSNRQRVMRASAHSSRARLCAERGEDGEVTHLQLVSDDDQARSLSIQLRGRLSRWEHDRQNTTSTWFNFGIAADLREESKREWRVVTGFWAAEALHAWSDKPDDRLHLLWRPLC